MHTNSEQFYVYYIAGRRPFQEILDNFAAVCTPVFLDFIFLLDFTEILNLRLCVTLIESLKRKIEGETNALTPSALLPFFF